MAQNNPLPAAKTLEFNFFGRLLAHSTAFRISGSLGQKGLRLLPHGFTHHHWLNAWAVARELPEPPHQSFREWYAQQPPAPVVSPDKPAIAND